MKEVNSLFWKNLLNNQYTLIALVAQEHPVLPVGGAASLAKVPVVQHCRPDPVGRFLVCPSLGLGVLGMGHGGLDLVLVLALDLDLPQDLGRLLGFPDLKHVAIRIAPWFLQRDSTADKPEFP